MSYYQFNRGEVLQNAKETILKKKLLSVIRITKKEKKKTQRIDTKTCQKKKKTRLKNIKEKDIRNYFSTKKNQYKINEFCFTDYKCQ